MSTPTFLQLRQLLDLVLSLHRRRLLPGIIFSFSRTMVTRMAVHLAEQLAAAEAAHRQRHAAALAPRYAAYAAAMAAVAAARRSDKSRADGGGQGKFTHEL